MDMPRPEPLAKPQKEGFGGGVILTHYSCEADIEDRETIKFQQ